MELAEQAPIHAEQLGQRSFWSMMCCFSVISLSCPLSDGGRGEDPRGGDVWAGRVIGDEARATL